MRKGYLLLDICLIGILISSCDSQSVSTLEPAATSTLLPPTVLPRDIIPYRGNTQRTGIYDVPAIRHQPEIQWQTKVSSTWLMPPLVADGILFTGSGDGILYALNTKTGEKIWSVAGFDQLESTGEIAQDRIVTGGYSKLVKALDQKTGDELWTYRTDHVIQGSPLIVDQRVYIATDHAVYALDLESGRLIWKVATGTEDAYMSTPAYDNGVIYTTGGKLLLALNAETGKEIWRVKKDENFLGLAVANHMIYVGNWDLNLYAFDQATGDERWKFPAQAGGVFWSAPAVSGNTVYAGNIDKFLYALDAQTGKLNWSFKTGGGAVSEPMIADGVVYVSDSSHEFPRGARHLYALDAETGEQLWVFETVSTFLPAPVLDDGTIYVTSTGDVIALK